jgi:hypothetical protein
MAFIEGAQFCKTNTILANEWKRGSLTSTVFLISLHSVGVLDHSWFKPWCKHSKSISKVHVLGRDRMVEWLDMTFFEA